MRPKLKDMIEKEYEERTCLVTENLEKSKKKIRLAQILTFLRNKCVYKLYNKRFYIIDHHIGSKKYKKMLRFLGPMKEVSFLDAISESNLSIRDIPYEIYYLQDDKFWHYYRQLCYKDISISRKIIKMLRNGGGHIKIEDINKIIIR